MLLWILTVALCAIIAYSILKPSRKVIDVSNSTVLITGAASGVGRQLAKQLADSGAKLILCDIQYDKLLKLRSKLKNPSSHECFNVNVSQPESISSLWKQDSLSSRRIDIVIANAGVVSGKSAKDLTDSDIDNSFAVNVKQHMYLAREIYKHLGDGSSFVAVASVAGMFPLTQLSDYCASKFALIGFMESLRSELRRDGRLIRTCTVCPFLIDTKMFAGIAVRFPANLLLKPLRKQDVARRIIHGVEHGESLVIMPFFLRILPIYFILPEFLRDFLRSLLQEQTYMDNFRGRPKQK